MISPRTHHQFPSPPLWRFLRINAEPCHLKGPRKKPRYIWNNTSAGCQHDLTLRTPPPRLYSLLSVINVTRSFPKNCCPCFCLLSYLSAFNCILMKFRHVTKTAWFQSSIAATHRLPPLNHKRAEVLSQEPIWDLFPPSFRSSFTITFDICWFNILQIIRTGSFHQEKQQDQPSPN